jgi:hypothetical protein
MPVTGICCPQQRLKLFVAQEPVTRISTRFTDALQLMWRDQPHLSAPIEAPLDDPEHDRPRRVIERFFERFRKALNIERFDRVRRPGREFVRQLLAAVAVRLVGRSFEMLLGIFQKCFAQSGHADRAVHAVEQFLFFDERVELSNCLRAGSAALGQGAALAAKFGAPGTLLRVPPDGCFARHR